MLIRTDVTESSGRGSVAFRVNGVPLHTDETLPYAMTFTVPAGTQPGDMFRLRGRGMPTPRGRGTGDLVVQVQVEVPKQLSAEQERLLRELAEVEQAEVSQHRKSFFEKLRDYFTPHAENQGEEE